MCCAYLQAGTALFVDVTDDLLGILCQCQVKFWQIDNRKAQFHLRTGNLQRHLVIKFLHFLQEYVHFTIEVVHDIPFPSGTVPCKSCYHDRPWQETIWKLNAIWW